MTATPAQQGHAGFPVAVDRAAGRLVERLARGIGHQAAVSWVHAGAVLSWAGTLGLAAGVQPADTAAGMRDGLARLADWHPALAAFADPTVVALWGQPVGDADAAEICDLWAEFPVDDPPLRTHGYLLGNAYQALSVEARRHRALAQTPRFVTDLLLDMAFRPAADEHGSLDGFRMVDPACGTGHILVETLIAASAWSPSGLRAGRVMGFAEHLEQAASVVHGVDLDAYAALLTRLRLVALVSVMLRANRTSRPGLPDRMPSSWPVQVAAADALLDRSEPLLERGRYQVVVMNPPYITPKDRVQRDVVRAAYPQVCSGRYALSLPFHQLADELLVPGGWCAQLTANSFMKREFGRRYVEEYLPQRDLLAVLDTSGAYIPGHGTPTVILLTRNRPRTSDTVFTVLGVRGEPSQPADPSRGVVWSEIARQVRARLSAERFAAGVLEARRAAGLLDAPEPAPAVEAPMVGLREEPNGQMALTFEAA